MKIETYKPFFVNYDDGDEGTLNLYDWDMESRVSVFESLGREGSGYDWDAIARLLASKMGSEKSRSLHFNSEAGMLSVYGPPEILLVLAEKLHNVFCDEQEIASCVSAMGAA
ncbi:Imm51 family immunity protein [Acidovorax sp. PRC11]|nr:Imm51 family immunity protein [Acidovorax sp. PRC11]MDT0137127.1 Imm51 family immunity protein [Acidovorax sp. PRC11]NOK07164.1 hypothetical protein [Myxococcus xanthus]